MSENCKIEQKHHQPIVYKVYEVMKLHVGKENAISATELGEMFGLSVRQLRVIVSTIRNSTELTRIIASGNGGYYMPRKEEFDRANRRLESQAYALLKVAYSNRRKAAKDGQMKIPLGEYYKDVFEAFGKDDSKAGGEQ